MALSRDIWMRRLASAYIAVATAGLAYLASTFIKMTPLLLRWMDVEFVNYGGDTVSGWETIFSLFESLSGMFFAPVLFAGVVFLAVIVAAYWLTGIASGLSLKKRS